MSRPKRWVDDPDVDQGLRETLRGAGGARRLDDVTRRRLSQKVARAAAVPAVAAGWLFVKSAAAALGAVVASAGAASYAGVLDWPAPEPARPAEIRHAPGKSRKPSLGAVPPLAAPVVMAEPEVAISPAPLLNPSPALPVVSASPGPSTSSGVSLAAEAQLLEQARREMRTAPEVALQIAAEHAQHFPRAQLASERALIQIEALHRLGRDAEARALARRISGGSGGGLYAERIKRLLGENAGP
jgi:hypothetical protein